jgi:hypothetical protein
VAMVLCFEQGPMELMQDNAKLPHYSDVVVQLLSCLKYRNIFKGVKFNLPVVV